jgi:hypothetical protein
MAVGAAFVFVSVTVSMPALAVPADVGNWLVLLVVLPVTQHETCCGAIDRRRSNSVDRTLLLWGSCKHRQKAATADSMHS